LQNFRKPMRFIASLTLIAALSFSFIGCKKVSDAETQAKKFCSCAGPMAQAMSKMKQASQEEKMALMDQYKNLSTEMETCLGGKEAQEAEVKKMEKMTDEQKKAYNDELKASMTKMCPDIAKAFEL
jgi:hypothetical protein